MSPEFWQKGMKEKWKGSKRKKQYKPKHMYWALDVMVKFYLILLGNICFTASVLRIEKHFCFSPEASKEIAVYLVNNIQLLSALVSF